MTDAVVPGSAITALERSIAQRLARARAEAAPGAGSAFAQALGATAPSDTLPSDTLPSGTLPSDTLPSDTLPSGTLPSGTLPSDTAPSGAGAGSAEAVAAEAAPRSRAETPGKPLRHTPTEEEARKSAQSFEALFVSQMMQPMFAGISTDPPFGGGHAEAMWRSLLIDEYGKQVTRAGGIGIADSVMKVMLKDQET